MKVTVIKGKLVATYKTFMQASYIYICIDMVNDMLNKNSWSKLFKKLMVQI